MSALAIIALSLGLLASVVSHVLLRRRVSDLEALPSINSIDPAPQYDSRSLRDIAFGHDEQGRINEIVSSRAGRLDLRDFAAADRRLIAQRMVDSYAEAASE